MILKARLKTPVIRFINRRTARKVNRIYGKGYFCLQHELNKQFKTISSEYVPIKRAVTQYLLERVIHGCGHAWELHRRHPEHSHSDIASITRGVYEATVNLLYLLGDQTNTRLAAFLKRSIQDEQRHNNSMQNWLQHKDADIARIATLQFHTDMPSEDELVEYLCSGLGVKTSEIGSWPSIKARAEEAGSLWRFYYDAMYRGLSSWQHGDASRIMVSPGYARIDPSQPDRNFFEGLGLMSWGYAFYYHLTLVLAERNEDAKACSEVRAVGQGAIGMARLILEPHIQRLQRHS